MNFSIELSSLLDFILEKDGSSNKENHEFEIGRQIIAISEGDGYWDIHGSIGIKIKKEILFF